jgi:hypothetical protein
VDGEPSPCNPFEEAMVRQAVESSWRLDRADRVWAAALSEQIDAAAGDEEEQARWDAAADLGRRLWAAPCGLRTELAGPEEPDRPEHLVNRLERTPEGCRWLLDRWDELRRTLDECHGWSPAQTVETISLLGKSVEETDDSEVIAILAAGLLLQPESPDPFADPSGEPISAERRARREWRLARRWGDDIPRSEDGAREILREIIDEAAAPLESLEQLHVERNEGRAAARAEFARFGDTPDAERLQQHQMRETRTLIRIVAKLRDARRKGYAVPKPPPTPRPPREPTGARLSSSASTPHRASAYDELGQGEGSGPLWPADQTTTAHPPRPRPNAAPMTDPRSTGPARCPRRRFQPAFSAAIPMIGLASAVMPALWAITAFGTPTPSDTRAAIGPASRRPAPPAVDYRRDPGSSRSSGRKNDAERSGVRPAAASGERGQMRSPTAMERGRNAKNAKTNPPRGRLSGS